jgi:hypothetical protein
MMNMGLCTAVFMPFELDGKMVMDVGKGKDKDHPITGHEGPERSRGIDLLFL